MMTKQNRKSGKRESGNWLCLLIFLFVAVAANAANVTLTVVGGADAIPAAQQATNTIFRDAINAGGGGGGITQATIDAFTGDIHTNGVPGTYEFTGSGTNKIKNLADERLASGVSSNSLNLGGVPAASYETNLTTLFIYTNFGFTISGSGTSAGDGNFFLNFTNSGINDAGYAVWTNSADVTRTVVWNDLDNPGFFTIENSGDPLYYASDPFGTWELGNGDAPAPTAIQTSKTFTNSVTAPTAVALAFTNAMLYVDAGANLPGIRGRKDRPFPSLHQAQAASISGDSYFVEPGQYQLSFNFTPVNAKIYAWGAVINYTTNSASGLVNNAAGFYPVGSCELYGGTWSNAYWSGASTITFARLTNFYAFGAKFFAFAFTQFDYYPPVSSNLFAEFESCSIRCSDNTSIGIRAENTNALVIFKNCTFQPYSLPGGFGGPVGGYGASYPRKALEFHSISALVSGCVFDWSLTTNTTSTSDLTNSFCIVATTNAVVTVGNNTFQLTPYKGGNGGAQKYSARDTGRILFSDGDFATISGNGSGLTSLNAANLTGTVPDARLSTNVTLNGIKTITGTGFSVAFTPNPDGSSNAAITVTGGTIPSVYKPPTDTTGTNIILFPTNGVRIYVLLTNDVYFLYPTNIPADLNTEIVVEHDASLHSVRFNTNGCLFTTTFNTWFNDTNANSWTIYEIKSLPRSGNDAGSPTNIWVSMPPALGIPK